MLKSFAQALGSSLCGFGREFSGNLWSILARTKVELEFFVRMWSNLAHSPQFWRKSRFNFRHFGWCFIVLATSEVESWSQRTCEEHLDGSSSAYITQHQVVNNGEQPTLRGENVIIKSERNRSRNLSCCHKKIRCRNQRNQPTCRKTK